MQPACWPKWTQRWSQWSSSSGTTAGKTSFPISATARVRALTSVKTRWIFCVSFLRKYLTSRKELSCSQRFANSRSRWILNSNKFSSSAWMFSSKKWVNRYQTVFLSRVCAHCKLFYPGFPTSTSSTTAWSKGSSVNLFNLPRLELMR